jgi:NAD(P)-dependent dehydrogenase (short-subunit alcohol dehydrogenase family)
MNPHYTDKCVVVAGGSSGINLGIASAFAQAGARVAVLSRQQGKIDGALAQLRQHGRPVLGFAADVRDADAVQQAMAEVHRQWGEIDVLVSGAAGNFVCAADQMPPRGFKAVVDIDLLGTFHVLRAAWDHLRKPGAALLNISSANSWLPVPGQVHVCAAKAGIDQITRTLALEWGPAGVRVNSLAPGPIGGTEGMARLAPTPEAEAAWTRCVPLQRLGSLADVARAALWLCSPEAAYITGVVLAVDGGLALGGSSGFSAAMVA